PGARSSSLVGGPRRVRRSPSLLPIRFTGAASEVFPVVDSGAAAAAAALAGLVLASGLVAAALGAGREVAAAVWRDELNGSEVVNRVRSFRAFRATSHPESSTRNSPTPRVCLNRLFFVIGPSRIARPGGKNDGQGRRLQDSRRSTRRRTLRGG